MVDEDGLPSGGLQYGTGWHSLGNYNVSVPASRTYEKDVWTDPFRTPGRWAKYVQHLTVETARKKPCPAVRGGIGEHIDKIRLLDAEGEVTRCWSS